ncbi:MAG: HDIG domain-containing protein [Fusobacteriaceae bacterium]|nr:HDIG domain-containing protein [Fusobacteriaceae bacterium]
MRIINLFGLKISLDIKRKSTSDADRYSPLSTVREKILYLILCMFVIVLSSKIALIYNNKNYKIGDFAEIDIYAQKSIVFRDDESKEKIIENMIKESGREYVYSAEAERVFIGYFNEFFNKIKSLKTKSISDIDMKGFEKKLGKKIPEDLLDSISKLNNITLNNLQKTSERFLKKAYADGIYTNRNDITLSKACAEELKNFPTLQRRLLDVFLVANYKYDDEKTKQKIYDKVSQIKDQYINIDAGTLLIKKGDVLNEKNIKILEHSNIFSLKKSILYFIANIVYLLLISTLFYVIFFTLFKNEILNKGTYRSVFLIIVTFFLVYRIFGETYLFLLPTDSALFLMLLITKDKFARAIFPAMLVFMLPMADYNLVYIFIYFVSFPLGCHFMRNVYTRSSILAAGIKSAMFRLVLFLLMIIFLNFDSSKILVYLIQIMISGIISGTLTVAILPYFERTFNILTVFKLLELGDLSHPLLKKLSVEAPGTFNHSMMVATLAENAAVALNIDHIFARVASYYHDIGKSKRPKFFSENREGESNPHDGLSAYMSRMIIAAHTKEGVEMGREYGIPMEIRDIMLEHHGTTLIAYFYNLAKSENPNVLEEEFRYPGPKPKSKESGIIMLADSIEAAVRSLDEKSAKAMEDTIRSLVKTKIEENQLVNTSLTFNDIESIIESFTKSLGGIHHERVKYPGQTNHLIENKQ